MKNEMKTREDVIAAVEAADLCCPEQVTDWVLDAFERGGPEAARAELGKAIANDASEARRLGIGQ